MKLDRVVTLLLSTLAATPAWSAGLLGSLPSLPQPVKAVPTTPVPIAAPVPVPIAAPVPTPIAAPISVPIAAPVPVPIAAPIPTPIAAPIPVPIAAPMITPMVQSVTAPQVAPVAAPMTLPMPAPTPPPLTKMTAPGIQPVTGVTPTLVAPAIKPGLVNPLAPPPPMAPKPAVTDMATKPMPAAALARPENIQGSQLSGAKIDMSDTKQIIDTTGLNTGAPNRKGGLSDLQREQGNKTFQTEDNKKAAEAKNFGLIGETVIKGADADTFAGERINSKHTGDTGNFRGSTAGNAGGGNAGGGNRGGSSTGGGNATGNNGTPSSGSNSSKGGESVSSLSPSGRDGGSGGGNKGGTGGVQGGSEGRDGGSSGGGKTDSTIETMLRMEGGTPTGNATTDTAELGYAQSVGSDGYQATKNMSADERTAYWANEKNKQGMGTDQKPREDTMGSGSGAPVGTTRAMQRQNARAAERAMSARKNKAGGNGDDQRVEQNGSGGPVRQVVGQDDKPAKAEGASTINMNKVLEINKTVNPVRN